MRSGALRDRLRAIFTRRPDALACWLAVALPLVQAVPLLWKTPLSHDHPTHLFKAWHFWEEMLGRGRLRGWSHFWAFGFPADELVPSGGEIWVALLRALTLGQLTWPRTYALAFAAFLVFKGYATYRFTRRFFGCGAALVCAWLTSLDVGSFSEGGWSWNTDWGVWPVSLSMCFVQLSIVEATAVLGTGQARHVLRAGAWMAAALMAHQVALLVLAVVFPLLVLEQCLRKRSPSIERFAQLGAAAALGVALPATTLVPFLARSGYAMDLGVAKESLAAVGTRLIELRTFMNVPPLVHGLALLGTWWAVQSPARGRRFLVLSAAAFVLLSSHLLTGVLHLERVLPSLIKIEAARCLLVAKVFWFPLAGYAVARLLRAAWAAMPRFPRGRAILWGLIGAGAAAILIGPALPGVYETQIKKQIQGEAETAHWADMQQAFEWSRQLRASETGHYRIAYNMSHADHLSTLAPVYDQTLMYKIGDTPTQIFDALPMTGSPAMLEALSVKYVVSTMPLALPEFSLERRFGQLGVYRFQRFDPDPFELVGPGRAALAEFSPERVRVRLSGTNAESRLRIHVAPYACWEARIDGNRVPISTVTVSGVEDPVLMEVPARDGELVLDYVYRASDWIGLGATLAALPAFEALRRLGLAPWHPLFAWLVRRRRQVTVSVSISAALLLVAVALRARDDSALLPRHSLFYGDVELSLGEERCERLGPLRFGCGAHRVQAQLVHGRGDHLCMTAPAAGALRVRVRGQLPSFLVGRYDAVGVKGSIEAQLDGVSLGVARTRPAYMRQQTIQFDTRARAGSEGELTIVLQGGPLQCFDFWFVR